MENIKQQIEEINQSIAEINQARDRTVEYFKNKIKQLEQQVNKPKIDVGKVYKSGNWLLFIKTKLDSFEEDVWCDVFGFHYDGYWINDERVIDGDWTEATKEEWETALTKHADKLYEGVEKVDRSGMDILWSDIESFKGHLSTVWNGKEFQYKGIFVMDKHGVWAKPCDKIDYDVEMINCTLTYNPMAKYIADGKYKLVKVG